MEICEECCQMTKDNCYCKTGKIDVKYIGLVSGCVKFDNNKRCKKICEPGGICDYHINQVSEENRQFLKKLF